MYVCVCVCVQCKCLKRQLPRQALPWDMLLCGFCFSPFFFCTHEFWSQELGKPGTPLEPSRNNTALLWHMESHRESAGYSSEISNDTPFIKPHCSGGMWAKTRALPIWDPCRNLSLCTPRPSSRGYRNTALNCPFHLTGSGCLKEATTNRETDVDDLVEVL